MCGCTYGFFFKLNQNSAMRHYNRSAIRTPIIGRVIQLNRVLAEKGKMLPHHKRGEGNAFTVDIRRCYLYPMLEKASLLFVYALRQLRGKDYLKRATEIVDEIQAQAYLIFELKGWCAKTCAEIDLLCDDIAEQLAAIACVAKSKDESK